MKSFDSGSVPPSPRLTHSPPNSPTINPQAIDPSTRLKFPRDQHHRPSLRPIHKPHRPLSRRMRSRYLTHGYLASTSPIASSQSPKPARRCPSRESHISDRDVEMGGHDGTISRLRIGILVTDGLQESSGETYEQGRMRTGHIRVVYRVVRVCEAVQG